MFTTNFHETDVTYILYDADQRIKAWYNFFDADLVFPSGFVFCTFLVFKAENES